MRTTMIAILAFVGLLAAHSADAAVGCTLTNPAQDLKYLYPQMTSYREEPQDLTRRENGGKVFEGLSARIGSTLDPVYETYDTPYTLYRIFTGDKLVGLVHGVNVPGIGGVIQVFVAVEPDRGSIQNFFFQRIESPAATALRKKDFRKQFEGLTLADFYKHDYYAVAEVGSDKDRIATIKPIAVPESGMADYQATLRGLRKNLVLLDVFAFDSRSEQFWERSQKALKERDGAKQSEPKKKD